jgi:tetratricopeptide (TPR) repeat protein
MRTKALCLFVLASALAIVAGCADKPVEFALEVKVLLDGRPVKDADVLVDGAAEGKTDARGMFAKSFARLPEQPVRLEVRKESDKFRAKAWEKTFSVKRRGGSDPKEVQAFTVDLQRYVVVAVSHEGKPLAGAEVTIEGKQAGATSDSGELEYVFDKWPKPGLRVAVKKEGFGTTSIVHRGESGDRIAVPLYNSAVVTVEALEERNGVGRPIEGATVAIGGNEVGKTGKNGIFVYRHKGQMGGTAQMRISAAGYLPSAATRTVTLAGSRKIQHYFQAAAGERPRAAFLGFAANTRGEDIDDVVKRVESAFVQELAGAKAFQLVPAETARDLIKRSKLTYEKLQTVGWRGKPLAEAVDVIVFGSVARGEGDSFVIEVSFFTPDGKLAMSQAVIAASSGSWRVGRAVNELVANVVSAYPVAGVVTAVNGENVQINVGRNQFPIRGEDLFVVQSARRGQDGRVTGHADGGTVKVRRTRDDHSETQAEALIGEPRPGDRAVRLDVTRRADGAGSVVIAVKGGRSGEEAPLSGANVYVDQRWAGTTNRRGEVGVPLRAGRKYQVLVYRHGYEQGRAAIEPAKSGERHEFALKSFTSDFTVESEPSGATVQLDDQRIGTTPITKPYPVTLGFRSVRIDAGGDWRAWEEVIEFRRQEESRKVILHKDYLKLADRAENARQFDEAIRLYTAAPKEHPDYAELRHRLGQLYLDDKRDYDRAIAELELVQALPEVDELVLKQYAVVYTNLGKAYYAKGESLLRGNRNDALQYFAKAAKALDRARENTRFFPNERHDEAVHDTYYYRALAYHNLYQVTKREALLPSVELAWHEYMDFFPAKLRGKPEFEHLRESGEKLARQVQDR